MGECGGECVAERVGVGVLVGEWVRLYVRGYSYGCERVWNEGRMYAYVSLRTSLYISVHENILYVIP